MFHIDDILLAHVNPAAVTEHAKKLDGACGLLDPLAVTRGKLCECLGMPLNFGAMHKACAIAQYDFIKKLCNSLPAELKGPCRKTPVPDNLFKVSKDAAFVRKEKADKYHEVTAKSL